MKIVRSILGIVLGIVLAVVVITAAETINGIVYQPNDGRTFMEWQEDLQKDMKAMKAWIDTLPQTAMVTVLLGWEFGNPIVVRPAPPVGAAIARSSGWSGRYWIYHSYSSYSSGTRSGVGGGGSGGK